MSKKIVIVKSKGQPDQVLVTGGKPVNSYPVKPVKQPKSKGVRLTPKTPKLR